MLVLHLTAREETLHRLAIRQLADETGHAPALVKAVWEREWAALAADARIRDYLPIFTLRKARKALALLRPPSRVVAGWVRRPASARCRPERHSAHSLSRVGRHAKVAAVPAQRPAPAPAATRQIELS